MTVWRWPRYVVGIPLLGYGIAQCGAFALLWGTWRLVSLLLPARYFHKVDDFLFERYQQLIVFLLETVAGSQLYLYGDYEQVLKKKENVIWISNHQSAADWVVCEMLALKQGSLNKVRYILKDTIKYIPIYGWYFPQHSCVFVRRSGTLKDIADIERQLDIYPKLNMPLWLIIFPEGTRFNPLKPDVIKKSQEFAKSSNLPILGHTLTPRAKAAMLSVNKLRDYADAIYDVTIGYEETQLPSKLSPRNPSISFINFGLGLFNKVHLKINRIDLKEAPTDEKEFKVWLHNLFVQKDRDLSDFYSDDLSKARRFSGPCFIPGKSTWITVKSVCFWTLCTTMIIWFNPTLWYQTWAVVLIGGPLYALWKR